MATATVKTLLKDMVKKGSMDDPFNVLLYGVEGIGKTTWAAGAPDPIFLCSEDGIPPVLSHVPRIVLSSWNDTLEAVNALAEEEHSYKSGVIDTADWIEALIQKHMRERDGKASIEDYGYGKGYAMAAEELRKLLSRLEYLMRVRKMNVIILAHCQVKTFNNPAGDNYDRYEMKLNKQLAGILREWPQAVLFAKYDTYIKKESKAASKGKAYGGGRVVHTVWSAAWDAKNRFNLPETMPLDWAEFETAARKANKPDPATVQWLVENWPNVIWPDDGAEARSMKYLGITQVTPRDLMNCAADRLKAMVDRLNQFIPQEETNAVS